MAQARRKGTTTTVPVDHEYAEVEEQANIPYRGYVDHGVDVAQNFTPDEDESQPPDVNDLVTWGHDDTKEPAPIPVYTVPGPGQSGVVHRLFRTWYNTADVSARMIAGRHEQRSKIKIMNDSDLRVWIGNDLTVSPLVGYPLDAGTSLELNTNREVYAITADPGPAPVYVYEEYTVQS